jgi:chaperonin GroEL
MAKKVFYDDDARRRVLGGAEILYNAVRTTMGPKGRNVVISKSYGNPTVTHDGVTVAKGIELDDVDDETLGYKVGAELIKEAANKMNDVAGDGTTTVTILTYHILNEANKLIAAGHNPMLLRKGLEKAAHDVLAKLGGLSEDISGKKGRLAEVATISAGDEEIGQLVAEVMEFVGKDGIVTVEESQGLETDKDVVKGFTFDRGFVSPYMITDTARMEAVYDKPAILVTDAKISSIQDFLPVLEKLANAGKKDLVLIADEVEGEALATLILNRLKGVFNTLAVKAPAFGDRRKEILEDIAILTGGEVISEETGVTFESAEISMVGSARKVLADKDNTTIIEGAGSTAAIKARIEQINKQIASATSEYDKENLEKRRAALEGKVAVIRVGGATETEIEEKKFRVDDAVAAVKAALDEGVVPGGGITYLNLAQTIPTDVITLSKPGKTQINIDVSSIPGNDDFANVASRRILKKALMQPFLQILSNAGLNGDQWLAEIDKKGKGWGIDVNNPEKLLPVKENGIVDPTRVAREAIQSAVSVAGTAMTMGALVNDVPDKTPPPAMPGGGGMDMM